MADSTDEQQLWVVKRHERELTYGSALGDDRYRITATALSMPGRIRPGAIVDTRIGEDGTREIVQVVARSTFRSASALLTRAALESPEVDELKVKIVDAGGEWEQVFGGIFLIHVPRDSGIDPRREIERLRR